MFYKLIKFSKSPKKGSLFQKNTKIFFPPTTAKQNSISIRVKMPSGPLVGEITYSTVWQIGCSFGTAFVPCLASL